MDRTDDYYMGLALEQARLAFKEGEAPIGAVIVRDGQVIASARNAREGDRNALRHAELTAIDRACAALGGWRLTGCQLYVTLEPCPMCAGAIINSRIVRVVYGARDPKAGCAGSVCDLFSMPFNHRPVVVGGVREEACSAILSSFFGQLRQRQQARRAGTAADL